MNNDFRKPAYLEVCRILLDEEIPFAVSDCTDLIEIRDEPLSVAELITIFRQRADLKETEAPPFRTFALLNVGEAFVEVMVSRSEEFNNEVSLRIAFMDDR